MVKKEFYRRACNGEGQVYTTAFERDNPKGIVQIVHGMSEHSGRYDDLAERLQKGLAYNESNRGSSVLTDLFPDHRDSRGCDALAHRDRGIQYPVSCHQVRHGRRYSRRPSHHEEAVSCPLVPLFLCGDLHDDRKVESFRCLPWKFCPGDGD